MLPIPRQPDLPDAAFAEVEAAIRAIDEHRHALADSERQVPRQVPKCSHGNAHAAISLWGARDGEGSLPVPPVISLPRGSTLLDHPAHRHTRRN